MYAKFFFVLALMVIIPLTTPNEHRHISEDGESIVSNELEDKHKELKKELHKIHSELTGSELVEKRAQLEGQLDLLNYRRKRRYDQDRDCCTKCIERGDSIVQSPCCTRLQIQICPHVEYKKCSPYSWDTQTCPYPIPSKCGLPDVTKKLWKALKTTHDFPGTVFRRVVRHYRELTNQGYTVLPADFYADLSRADSQRHLAEIQSTFWRLKADNYSNGNRERAFDGFFYDSTTKQFARTAMSAYQSTELNPVDGGKLRSYDSLDEKLLENPLFCEIISKDIELLRRLGVLSFNDSLLMRIIQNRYTVEDEQPSYATPPWLHIDDETVTILHLLDITDNLIGGDAVIAADLEGTNVLKVIRLLKPLDTYMVTQKIFHAVTPMDSLNKADAYRHIFIIAFKNVSEDERKMTVHMN